MSFAAKLDPKFSTKVLESVFPDPIIGGFGAQEIHGTENKDIIWGDDGPTAAGPFWTIRGNHADILYGHGGDDTMYGEHGADTLFGGEGADHLDGGTGNDFLDGGAGSDNLFGGAGNDLIFGGDGIDNLHGEAGDDSLFGGDDFDWINGGAGDDWIDGGDGNDYLMGEAAGDLDHGDDIIYGGLGDDELRGRSGNDSLFGGVGNDVLKGEFGEDYLSGGDGDDILYGGYDGADIAPTGSYTDGWEIAVKLDDGNDVLDGGAGNDLLIGGGGANILTGGSGADGFALDNYISNLSAVPDYFQPNIITDYSWSGDGDKIEGHHAVSVGGNTTHVYADDDQLLFILTDHDLATDGIHLVWFG